MQITTDVPPIRSIRIRLNSAVFRQNMAELNYFRFTWSSFIYSVSQTCTDVSSSIFGLGDLENMGFAAGIFLISLSIAELKLLPVYVVAISISGVGRHAPMLAVAFSVWATSKTWV